MTKESREFNVVRLEGTEDQFHPACLPSRNPKDKTVNERSEAECDTIAAKANQKAQELGIGARYLRSTAVLTI